VKQEPTEVPHKRHGRNPRRSRQGGRQTQDKDAYLKRLRRIEGQVRGVERMVEENRYCIDVVTQVTAIQAALDKVALELLSDHAAHCVAGAAGGDQQEMTDELMAAVRRLVKR
jgi:CsoR family transcriptional regulator, copper-sensing transcriptional repressor